MRRGLCRLGGMVAYALTKDEILLLLTIAITVLQIVYDYYSNKKK